MENRQFLQRAFFVLLGLIVICAVFGMLAERKDLIIMTRVCLCGVFGALILAGGILCNIFYTG